jgi:hypothetical protein
MGAERRPAVDKSAPYGVGAVSEPGITASLAGAGSVGTIGVSCGVAEGVESAGAGVGAGADGAALTPSEGV